MENFHDSESNFYTCVVAGPGPSVRQKMTLNSGDETHTYIRSRNISEVGGILKEQAQAIQKGYKESRVGL